MDLRDKKEIGVVIFTCLFSIVEFFSVSIMIGSALRFSAWTVGLCVLSIIWLAVMTCTLALSRTVWGKWILAIIPSLAMAVAGNLSSVAIGGAIFLTFFTWLAQRAFFREINNRIRYQPFDVFPPGLKLLMMGLIVALIAMIIPSITGSIIGNKLQVTDKQLDPMLKPFDRVIANWLPGYTHTSSIDDIIRYQINEQLSKLPSGVTFDTAGQTQIARANISRQLGQQLTGKETVAVIAASVLNSQIHEIGSKSPWIVSVVLVIVVFLTLGAIIPFLVWPVIGVVVMILWLSRLSGLVYLIQTPTVIERLQL